MLGRGVVIGAGRAVPAPWVGAPAVRLDDDVLADPQRLDATIDTLHRAWVARTPVVVEWDGAEDMLQGDEVHVGPLWELAAGFLFPKERLRFLCFSNSYDARNGDPRWWWEVKARRIGAEPGGPADVVLGDGSPAWIDGGPRMMLPSLEHPVIHGESVDLGISEPVPPPQLPPLDGLAADQYEAAAHSHGPARIIAPAGSGKTRTLAARLRHVLDRHRIDVRHVTALAYNERAAAELRERLSVDRSLARTIHSLGWEILREARPGLELIDERGVRDIFERVVQVPRRANTDPIGPYIEALSAVRSRLRDPAEVEASRDDVTGFADAFALVRDRMYAMGRVDHGEQVYGAIEALVAEPALRARWQRRCRHLLVDEFQDLTPAFVLLLRLVASPQLSVFGVGDDDQVIYGYDGADPGFLIDFDDYFPGSQLHALETNYRCPQPVVDAARHLLSYNARRIDKTIQPAKEGSPDALRTDSLAGQALVAGAADEIEAWIGAGVEPHDIAVLTRVNASLIPVKAALVERGIPTADLLGPGSLDRTAVRALFAWIRLGQRPEQMARTDLLAAVRRPSRGLNRLAVALLRRRAVDLDGLSELASGLDGKQAVRWEGFCDDVRLVASAVAQQTTGGVIRTVVDRVGLGSSARTLDSGRTTAARSAHLDDLVAIERAAPLHPDVEGFIPWIRSAVAAATDPAGVTLSSVHRVKGMEWSHVVVFGADRGAIPHDLAEDVEEERRVFHVAITRGQESVLVLSDAARPSPFLAELDGTAPRREHRGPAADAAGADLIRMPDLGDRVQLWGGIEGTVAAVSGAEIEVRLDSGSETTVGPADIVRLITVGPAGADVDPTLVAALKDWRRATAQRLGVPAYVVLHDKTIEEIVALRPSTERQLLQVTGIGPAKLENYGDDILAVVAAADSGATS